MRHLRTREEEPDPLVPGLIMVCIVLVVVLSYVMRLPAR